MEKIDRTGEKRNTSNGHTIEIIKYNNYNDLLVKFENGYTVKTDYGKFLSCNIRNPYDKNTYDVGYLGEGKYKTKINGKFSPQFQLWNSMMRRCYSEYQLSIRPSYYDVSVCEEWHNFQTFAAWYDENYYQIEGEKMHLDKDILVKGNKVYSPETCIFVPQKINVLFIKSNVKRGYLPIGVQKDKGYERYIAYCGNGTGYGYIGRYGTPEEAFQAYKQAKEKHIKEVAEEFKFQIPDKLYNAMITYEVEITD